MTAFTFTSLPIDRPMPMLERRRIIGTQAMLSHISLQAGCHVPTHAHENEQFAVVVSGTMTFGLGAEGSPERRNVTLNAGQVMHLPANLPHSATAVTDCVILDVFSPPSQTTGIDLERRAH